MSSRRNTFLRSFSIPFLFENSVSVCTPLVLQHFWQAQHFLLQSSDMQDCPSAQSRPIYTRTHWYIYISASLRLGFSISFAFCLSLACAALNTVKCPVTILRLFFFSHALLIFSVYKPYSSLSSHKHHNHCVGSTYISLFELEKR